MDRRGFLKRIGQTIAGLTVVLGVAKAKEPFAFDLESEGRQELTDDEKMANAILECYEELGRPIGPLAQLRKEMRKRNQPYCIDFVTQDIIRSDEEYDEFIKAYLKRYNFPKEQLMD